jgi:hypothetical protein
MQKKIKIKRSVEIKTKNNRSGPMEQPGWPAIPIGRAG